MLRILLVLVKNMETSQVFSRTGTGIPSLSFTVPIFRLTVHVLFIDPINKLLNTAAYYR